jgi:GAF domain-containing protein
MTQPDGDTGLKQVADRLGRTLERDALVQDTLMQLRSHFNIDRVVLYYFYRQWKGQVTAEALRNLSWSIYGSTGADNCFNDNYAALYLQGRIRAVDNVKTANLHPCHLDFLQSIEVQANLVAPILTSEGLWGLIVAHDCQRPHPWSNQDIEAIRRAADRLSTAPSIAGSYPQPEG